FPGPVERQAWPSAGGGEAWPRLLSSGAKRSILRVQTRSERSSDMTSQTPGMSPSEKVDALEERMIHELDVRIAKSPLFVRGETDPSRPDYEPDVVPSSNPNAYALQGDDPRL